MCYLAAPSGTVEESADEDSHLRRSHGTLRDWFPPEDIARFRSAFQPYMTHYGYVDGWTVNPMPRILPEHASEYAERTVRRKRRAAGL